MNEVHITLKDFEKRQSTIVILGCKDKSAALNIAKFIDDRSAAAVVQWAYVERENYAGALQEGNYDSVDQQNLLLFTDSEGFSLRFTLPAPQNDTLDEAQDATDTFAGEVLTLLESNTVLSSLLYQGGGLTAQFDLP